MSFEVHRDNTNKSPKREEIDAESFPPAPPIPSRSLLVAIPSEPTGAQQSHTTVHGQEAESCPKKGRIACTPLDSIQRVKTVSNWSLQAPGSPWSIVNCIKDIILAVVKLSSDNNASYSLQYSH